MRHSPILRAVMALLALAGLVMAAGCGPRRETDTGPLVLAASSLQDALAEAAAAWTRQGHPAPVLSFAATSALARQIEAGAPADLFVSADERWMDELEAGGLIRDASRRDLVGNALVVIAPARDATRMAGADGPALLRALGDGRLAMADPDAVPAGRYARQALESLDAWDALSSRSIPAENVRVALALVARGEATLGVVYASDAKTEPNVRVVHTFAPETHAPIVYPAALLKAGTHPGAEPFLAFLASREAGAIFRRHGFAVIAGK